MKWSIHNHNSQLINGLSIKLTLITILINIAISINITIAIILHTAILNITIRIIDRVDKSNRVIDCSWCSILH